MPLAPLVAREELTFLRLQDRQFSDGRERVIMRVSATMMRYYKEKMPDWHKLVRLVLGLSFDEER